MENSFSRVMVLPLKASAAPGARFLSKTLLEDNN